MTPGIDISSSISIKSLYHELCLYARFMPKLMLGNSINIIPFFRGIDDIGHFYNIDVITFVQIELCKRNRWLCCKFTASTENATVYVTIDFQYWQSILEHSHYLLHKNTWCRREASTRAHAIVFIVILQCVFVLFLAFCYFLHLVFLLLIWFFCFMSPEIKINKLRKKQETHSKKYNCW